MTHLYIEQNTGLTEEVNSSIISKLYELAISGDLDNTSDLKGRLHSSAAKKVAVEYLNETYQDLHISADVLYLQFADSYMEQYLQRYIGTSEGVTMDDIQTFQASGTAFGDRYYNNNSNSYNNLFTNNTERDNVTSFNELEQFVGITTINAFTDCHNLTSVRLPQSIITIGTACFRNTNLQSIDLSNIQVIRAEAFKNSSLSGILNLPSIVSFTSNNTNAYNNNGETFLGCGITQVNIGQNFNNFTAGGVFQRCQQLQQITGLSTVTQIPNYTFTECSVLSNIDINFQNITKIGRNAFDKCYLLSSLETIDIPNLVDDGGGLTCSFRYNTTIKHIVSLGQITLLKSLFGDDGAFSNCTELLDAVLPETLSEIGLFTFIGCSKLRYVKILATSVPTYNLVNGFNNTQPYGRSFGESYRNNDTTQTYVGHTYPVYVVDSLLSQYQAADGWKYLGPNRLRPLSQFATDFPNG